MLFYSLDFILFFIPFFFLYWYIFNKHVNIQNLLILAGSYVFIGWWDWRFLSLLISSSIVNYFLGIAIARTENEKRQRLFLNLGLLQSLGFLLFFKYFNFFIDSFVTVFAKFNVNLNLHTLNLILPLGISFYTFRAISYLLDVESGKTKPVKNWVVFFNYLSFFPSFLSGPIDKARDFIPQLEKKRIFDDSQLSEGLRQILWGLFKKIVIADTVGTITKIIFEGYEVLPASTLLLGAFLYAIEIYADFSGYSDMAIGISRLIGFRIANNFNYPFFAQNIAEFWQRWHISLTTWMTEYVFTPLSFIFRTYGKLGTILAIIINFVIVGLWHGANWTFIVYGFLHGCYFIPLIISGTVNKKKQITNDRLLPTFTEFMKMAGTFTLVVLTLILFKSDSIVDAYNYYSKLISSSLFSFPSSPVKTSKLLFTLFFISIMFVIEWLGRGYPFAIANFGLKWNRSVRWAMYTVFLLAVLYFAGKEQQFIYFQF